MSQNQTTPTTTTVATTLTFTTEQWVAALEKAVREIADLEAQQQQLGFVPLHLIRAHLEEARTKLSHLGAAQGVPQATLDELKQRVELLEKHNTLQTRLEELRKRVNKLRVGTLQSIKHADVASLTRAIGVMHAYPVFLALGIGTLPGLISCARNQFSMWARPSTLGWGGAAVPERIDEEVVKQVEAALVSVGLHWRQPNEAAKVRLPEAVLEQQFPLSKPMEKGDTQEVDQQKNPRRRRFVDSDFLGYAHPSIVLGLSGRTPSISKALAMLGIYSWEDLELRTAADLKSLMTEQQFATVQWEMRRRGLLFQREEKPAVVYMDAIDSDRINPDEIKEETVVSQEDRVRVRDKTGKLVSVIEAKNEYSDRVGAEDDLQLASGSEGPMGITETYEEREVEEEAVADEEETVEAQPQGIVLAAQAQPTQAPTNGAGIALQQNTQAPADAVPPATNKSESDKKQE